MAPGRPVRWCGGTSSTRKRGTTASFTRRTPTWTQCEARRERARRHITTPPMTKSSRCTASGAPRPRGRARTRQERRREDRGGGAAAAATSRRPIHIVIIVIFLSEALRVALLTKTRRRRAIATGVFAETVGATSRSRRGRLERKLLLDSALPMALDTIARRLRGVLPPARELRARRRDDQAQLRAVQRRGVGVLAAAALEETLASDVPPTNRDATALGVEPTAASGTESTRTERGARD